MILDVKGCFKNRQTTDPPRPTIHVVVNFSLPYKLHIEAMGLGSRVLRGGTRTTEEGGCGWGLAVGG